MPAPSVALPDRVAGRERRAARHGGASPLAEARAVVRPRRRPQPLALDALLRQLVEEPRRQVRVAAPVERAAGRVQHRQPLLRARHPDVAEAALLLDVVLLDRARVREDPLLHPEHEDGAELEPLRVVERHQRDLAGAVAVAQRVLVRVERDLLQERRERRLVGRGLVLARDADELLEVLDLSLRLPLRQASRAGTRG